MKDLTFDKNISLDNSEMLLLCGKSGTIAIVKVGPRSQFFLETDDEEIVLGLDPNDLIVASAFSTGKLYEDGLKCVLYMVRELKSPLIVLPKNHKASARLPIVVSAGERTVINCNITPGTHPNQDVLCGSGEFNGLEATGTSKGVKLKNCPQCEMTRVKFKV
ncbi:MAG TPA: hypothetical protein C5S50_06715 [Methanosarcinaceae archaeon]|nr:hypothetical protein [Methanosarcinaceae archaeon]